jgi:hypothetical protein
MNDKPKTKWLWRLSRWGLAGLAGIVTLVAVVVTEENWRGKRAWENYKQQAAAKGEQLDRIAFTTDTFSDEQNFTKSPIFSRLAATEWDPKERGWELDGYRSMMRTTRSDGTFPKKMSGDWTRASLTDLKGWQQYYRTPPTNSAGEFPIAPQPQSPAADILLALSKYDQTIEALRLASQRPHSRFADDYDANDSKTISLLLTYLGELKSCCFVVQLRALAELADGQTAKAFDDVKLLLRLNDTLRQEPLVIAHLVSLATMSITMQPIYEGLAQHQWSEAQLAELEKKLTLKDFLADYPKAMRGERAFAIGSLENQRLTREYKMLDNSSGTNKITTVSFRLTPGAFFYQNELSFARLHEQFCLPLVDLEKRVASPAVARRADAAVHDSMRHYNPYKILALMTFPAISKSVVKFAIIQAQVDLACVACALERHHLARGGYPEALDALVPQFIEKLPHDIINGRPLHYRLTDAGQFVLYSVGWNEADDGGQVALTKSGLLDREKGDWVWRYPTR